MANALNVKIGGDIRELEKALNQASSKIKSAGKSMMSVGKTLSASVTAPLTALGITSLKTAADFETLQQSMNVLNGSVEEGARNFERLKEFSAGTPFQLGDLAKAQNMLQGFGMAADDAFESISMIGDIAAITGGSIEGIGVAFGQASAEGMLMTRDIRQLVNQGVPALQLLADTMGVGKDEIFDLASQGKISFEILQEAFRNATSEGGMFANGMQVQSQTLNGLFSTLKDNISIAMAEIGNSMAEAMNLREVVPAMIERIRQVTDWFKNLSTEARTTMVNIVRAIATIGPALIAVGATVTALGVTIALLTSPITLVVAGIAGLVTAIIYMRDNWEAVIERVSDIGWWRNAIVSMSQFLIKYSPISLAIKQFNALLGFFGDTQIPNPFDGIAESLDGLRVKTKEYKTEFGSLREAFLNTFQEFSGIDLANMFTPVTDGTNELAASVQKTSRNVTSLKTSLQGVATGSLPVYQVSDAMNQISAGAAFAQQMTTTFTNSFGQGLANVIVQGKSLVDVLNNIGRLVASAAIQTAIQAFLIGGLGGGGWFGAAGGLFGKIFNDVLITSDGQAYGFHPDDNILAMKDFSNLQVPSSGGSMRVYGVIKGEDIHVSSERGGDSYGR